MRILLVAEGIEAAALDESRSWSGELATSLARRGHRVVVVSTDPLRPDDPAADPEDVTVLRPSPGTLDRVLVRAAEQGPDVIHLACPATCGRDARRALRRVPLVIDAFSPWPVCANGDLVRRPAGTRCAEHHAHADCGACAGLTHLAAMEVRAAIVRSARVHIAHARALQERLEPALGAPVRLVRCGVDPARFRPEPVAPLSPDVGALFAGRHRPRVLVVGPPDVMRTGERLTDLLVALNARVPGVELVLAGHDGESPEGPQVLFAEAREMGLREQVRAFPDVSRADLPALVASCQVACSPGGHDAGGGLFAMRALAAGLPIVAHPGGVLAELVEHGREGLLAPADEVGPFANAIAALLRDPAARAAYGERARLAAIERFDLERAVFAHEELFERARGCDARHGAGRRGACSASS